MPTKPAGLSAWLRRIRAALFTAFFWGVLWIPIGIAIGLFHWWRHDLIDVGGLPPSVVARLILARGLVWGILGTVNGALFAIVLSIAERRQSVASLSLTRMTLWGAIATIALPVIGLVVLIVAFPVGDLSVDVLPLALVALFGAVCGATMLWIGRRSPAVAVPGDPDLAA